MGALAGFLEVGLCQLVEVADDEPGELASTDGGPRTAERRGKLEGSEWAGVGLAIVLAGVALVAILTWLL